MICFFHKWVAVAVGHYIDTSFGGNAPSSNVTLKCAKCGKLKSQSLYNAGFLTLEQLQ